MQAKLEVYPELVEGPALSLSKGFVTSPQGCGRYRDADATTRRPYRVRQPIVNKMLAHNAWSAVWMVNTWSDD